MFAKAIRSGDVASVRSMAAANPALIKSTNPGSFGAAPLIEAVGTDDHAMVDLLLDLGADLDQKSDWWAGGFGILDSASDEMSTYLLQRGATLTPHAAARLGMIERLTDLLDREPTLIHARGGDGQTPLHFARTAAIAELLLSRGADVDARDIDHASTPAQWLGDSRPEVALYLVSRGAGADPFLAARTGDIPLLERLLRSEPDGVRVRVTRDRFPAAPPAAGHIYLYAVGEGCRLVHAAAAANQAAVIRWLAAAGADVNARGGYDDATPLHIAAWGDKPEAIRALLDSGADINVSSGALHQNQPIGWAIVAGAASAFQVLHAGGAMVREHHITDARNGAQGAFRELIPRRPLASWRQIAGALVQR